MKQMSIGFLFWPHHTILSPENYPPLPRKEIIEYSCRQCSSVNSQASNGACMQGAWVGLYVSQDIRDEGRAIGELEKAFFISGEVFDIVFNHKSCRALLALFFSFQREMVHWRVIPQHDFLSFSCWDVLARSSPLVYWLQTICDCMGLWLFSLQNQEMQSIHEKHRAFFFFL